MLRTITQNGFVFIQFDELFVRTSTPLLRVVSMAFGPLPLTVFPEMLDAVLTPISVIP